MSDQVTASVFSFQPKPANSQFIDMEGQRFGRYLVIGYAGKTKKDRYWICRCDCGQTRKVKAGNIVRGTSRSCGCLSRETTGSRVRTHGATKTAEFNIWSKMIARCTNSNNPAWINYGGRGIKVCERWMNSFSDFLADVGPRPSPKHSIDRFPDNDGNYEPGNVRWATQIEQNRNRRSNHFLTFNGITATLTEWSERTGIRKDTLRRRIAYGWSAEKALTQFVDKRRCRKSLLPRTAASE